MNHPKSENVLKVVKNFESVLHLAVRKNHLNMQCVDVNADYTCGTIHCHGGWYAIGSKLHEKATVSFASGTHQMAKDLGFEFGCELELWAKENPTIWGNKFGKWMFCDKRAFYHPTKRPNGAETLQHIIYHWVEVAGRLKEMEAPVYHDLTKELAVLPIEEKSDVVLSLVKI